MATKIWCLTLAAVVIVIGTAAVFLKRADHQAFHAAQEKLLAQVSDLEERLGNASFAAEQFSSSARAHAETTQSLLHQLSESLRKLEARIGVLEERHEREDTRPAAPVGTIPVGDDGLITFASLKALFGESYIDEVELPPEAETACKDWAGPRMIPQNGFDSFVEGALVVGLLPFADAGSIPEEAREQLQDIFETFTGNMELISQQMSLNTAYLVHRATAKGEYEEKEPTPREGFVVNDPTQQRNRPRRPSGIGVGRERLNGKRREYFFSYGDHPEMTEAFKLEEQAKRHLFRDLYLLGKRFAEQ